MTNVKTTKTAKIETKVKTIAFGVKPEAKNFKEMSFNEAFEKSKLSNRGQANYVLKGYSKTYKSSSISTVKADDKKYSIEYFII